MGTHTNGLVQKLWNYCNILLDDGQSYGDYVEQLTFLLFLKMVDEQSKPPFNKPSPIPKGYGWDALLKLDGDDLEIHYRHTLELLGKQSGMLGVIFRKAQNKIQDPAKVRRAINEKMHSFGPTKNPTRSVELRLVRVQSKRNISR
jgi:type I restriction enzyme M protein